MTEFKHPSWKAAREHASNKERLPDGRYACVACDLAIEHGTLNAYMNWRCRCEICKKGTTDARKEYYDSRKDERSAYMAQRFDSFKKWYQAQKIGGSCADCGLACTEYNYPAFDWDHRPGEEKLFALATAIRTNRNKDQLLAEMAKCDLRCANCHRIITHFRSYTQ